MRNIIAFHTNNISLRGTEIALYDYAHYNESILGNKSYIITRKSPILHDEEALNKFSSRFEISYYDQSTE